MARIQYSQFSSESLQIVISACQRLKLSNNCENGEYFTEVSNYDDLLLKDHNQKETPFDESVMEEVRFNREDVNKAVKHIVETLDQTVNKYTPEREEQILQKDFSSKVDSIVEILSNILRDRKQDEVKFNSEGEALSE